MKEKREIYICDDLVKLWCVLIMSITLMLTVSSDWGTIQIILSCSLGGVFIFFTIYFLFILVLSLMGIDVLDKKQYDELKTQESKVQPQRIFSYSLYGWIMISTALICGGSLTNYYQSWSGIILEWIAYGAMGFIGSQIIMRIIFLMGNITTNKGDIESMAHEIERRRAEKKELKKQRKADRRHRNSWLSNAFFRGLGFGAGWGMFNNGNNDGGL